MLVVHARSRLRPPRRRIVALAVIVAPALGCPNPSDGGCGEGELEVELRANHGDGSALDDGSELAIFPPPQGGVFTELDVELRGVAADDLGQLQIRITRDDGASLANVTYQGSGLPLLCQDDGALSVMGLPVGFDLTYDLADLDGDAATFTVDVITASTSMTESWPITLVVVEY